MTSESRCHCGVRYCGCTCAECQAVFWEGVVSVRVDGRVLAELVRLRANVREREATDG